MKTEVSVIAKCCVMSSLMMGTLSALAQVGPQPTVIKPTSTSAPVGIAPIGIGATSTELLFSSPYCVTPGQPRGVYNVTGLAPGVPGALDPGTAFKLFPIPELGGCGGAENYFAISPGLGGFPANSVYVTSPTSAGANTDVVLVDGNTTPFITGISDSESGHAGITFDTVGTFANALIVTSASAVTGYDPTGALLFTYPTPASGAFLESATVAPLSNTACPGCLYITSDVPPNNLNAGGAIFTVAPGTPTGTPPTFAALFPGTGEPEGIQFVTPQVCTNADTGLAYFVSGFTIDPFVNQGRSFNGVLLGYSPAQLAPFVGKALIPAETGGTIYAFDPNAILPQNKFATFSTPLPIGATSPNSTYQFEGNKLAACAPSPSKGRMTGGGSFFTPDNTRVTHGMQLHCSLPSNNNLEVNWGGGNNFHLDALTNVSCFLDPAFSAGQPSAGFNTMIGSGTGTLNGAPATIAFEFIDAGEPGTSDKASVVIVSGTTSFTVPLTVLDNGNQQAHK